MSAPSPAAARSAEAGPVNAPDATRILAIRHGETPWNAERRMQGHTDIALSPVGLEQARRLGQALQAEPIAAVYASDLQRATQTATEVAQAVGLAVTQDSGLRERCFGALEGHTHDELEAQFPVEARRWRERDVHFAPPGGGESLLELDARVRGVLARIAARHAGELIVLVSHGGVLDLLYRQATGLALDARRTWALNNCTVNRLLWTPQALTLLHWNDDAHLADLTSVAAPA